MEQRPLRLGDIVDDYCPRERRVTNHAIVAIVEDVIRQTRCTACDAEHPFKGAREPRLRRRPVAGEDLPLPAPPGQGDAAPMAASAPGTNGAPDAEGLASDDGPPGADDASGHTADERADAWLAHRQLIRATLPKTDNDPPPPRPIPEFTMHQRPARGGRSFRFFGGHGNGNGNGNANGNVNGNVNGPARGGLGQGRPGGKHGGRRHRSRRPR